MLGLREFRVTGKDWAKADQVIEGNLEAAELARWLLAQDGMPLAFSSAEPESVIAVQNKYGSQRAAQALESFFADVAGRE